MKIPTANIVVAFDKETMKRLFSAGGTFTSLVGRLSDDKNENALLFDSESNPNFMSFEHSQNFGGGTKFTLEFIDPKGEFERRYMTSNMIKNIAGYDYAKPQHQDVLSDKKNKGLKDSQAGYDPKYFQEYVNEYKAEYGTRSVYIAYGAGENLDLWSGPHHATLNSADISVKGARKIKLSFAATGQSLSMNQRRGAYNEKVNLNLAGMRMRYSGTSKPILFSELMTNTETGDTTTKDKGKNWRAAYDPLDYLTVDPEVEYLTDTKTDAIQKIFKALELNDLVSNLTEFDIHSMIVDALRSYIQKATGNPNVIVLLPNINLICRKILDELTTNSRIAWAGPAITENPAQPGAQQKEAIDTYYVNSDKIRKVGLREQFIISVLETFGLKLHSYLTEAIQNSSEPALPQQNINSIKSYEKRKDANERFESQYLDRSYYAVLEKASDEGIPDHMAVVKCVIDAINKQAAEDYNIKLGYMVETNLDILNLWSTHKTLSCSKYPLFGGYRAMDPKREAILVGDQALIRNYLYGHVDLEIKEAQKDKIKELYVAAKKDYNNYNDPDNLMLAEDEPNQYQYQPEPQTQSSMETYEFNQQQIAANNDRILNAKNEKNALLVAALKNIPLHPLDRVILTNVSYNKKMKELVIPPKGSRIGSFGDISDIPDQFAFGEFTDKEKELIEDEQISVFRYNTENPNVLDLTFKFSGIYFGALQTGFAKMVERRASGVAAGILPEGTGSFPVRTRGDAAAFLRTNNYSLGMGDEQRRELRAKLARSISPELAESMESDELEAADVIAATLDDMEENDLKGYVEIGQMLPGNPQSVMTKFASDMYKQALNLEITTLPAFHLSECATMAGDCILFAQDAAITQSQEPPRTTLNSFFSGYYKILGYQHIIKPSASTSKFKLTKHVAKEKKKEIEAAEAERAAFFDKIGIENEL